MERSNLIMKLKRNVSLHNIHYAHNVYYVQLVLIKAFF